MKITSSTLIGLMLVATLGAVSSIEVASRPKSVGIVVPKRAALIAGLNQQFKSRQAPNQTSSGGQQHHQQLPNVSKSLLAAAGAQLVGLVKPNTAPSSSFSASSSTKRLQHHKAGVYLDRQQQQLLAANPSLPLNVASDSSAGLLTRSDVVPGGQQHVNEQPFGRQSGADVGQQPASSSLHSLNQQQQQQLYRGYSLIELEVKSEADRRYVQELYGNLSAALNEQAVTAANGHQKSGQTKQPPTTVSPYADIDFWSFKCALNDQIDIMVSPKSRPFILAQLGRAKIKHRVKIDDIQSRLDQSQPSSSSLTSSSSSSGMAAAGSNQIVSSELSGRQSSLSGPTNAGQQHHQPPAGTANNQAASNESMTTTTTRNQQQHLVGRQHQHQHDHQQQQPAMAADPMAGTSHMNDSLFFENYQRLNEINQYLESIVARARDVAKVQVIGRSSQGRYLRVLRLGYEQRDIDGSTATAIYSEPISSAADQETQAKPGSGSSSSQLPPSGANNASRILENFFRRHQNVKKLGSIWLDGGTHAREWISPATVLYMTYRLSDNHARCMRFFDYLNMVVNQVGTSTSAAATATVSARSFGPARNNHDQLEEDLLMGINEINTSLLGGQTGRPRQRSELEEKLELLAKRPQEVASEHACDLELEQLLRRYTFYIMPVLNPDGYEYSHTHNRLWRKTRSTSNHPIYRHFCLGADPNRNYDARHGSTGSSSHPCSQTYGGTTPFTEPETRHQSNFVYAHRANMKMFISFHSYSQMILLPFSHSKQLAPDHKDLESVGQAAVRAIERTHGTQYRVGPSASILYTASGTASDWAYEKAGVKYSYTIELRDTGTYGFLLPRQQIVPTGEETFNGLLAMIGQMEKNDNLLTSKSMLQGNSSQHSQTMANGTVSNPPVADYVHAPDLDQLRPFNRFRPRPAQLENALDGSNSWATAEPPMLGVRDRKPAGADMEPSGEQAYNSAHRLEDESISTPSEEPDAGYAFEGEGELMEPTNNELDHLMMMSKQQATGNEQDKLIKRSEHAQLYGHMHAHSSSSSHQQDEDEPLGASGEDSQLFGSQNWQRFGPKQMPSAMALSANGRNLINSPPLPTRTTASSPRRESSQDAMILTKMAL